MPDQHLQFQSVSFTYDTQNDPLFDALSFGVATGWTGVVGPNGIGKTTLLGLATGSLLPAAGTVLGPESVMYCAQRTDEMPDDLPELLAYPDADAGRLVSMLGIDADWPYRWESLSHGERKRAQLGVALWRAPVLLAVDEPTNHLDGEARGMVLDGLASFRGIGLIVSHDRELLDALCGQCLFLSEHREPVVRPGGVTAGLAEEQRENDELRESLAHAAAQEQRLTAEANRRRQAAQAADGRRSKRGLDPRDHDARDKIDRARVSGADGHAGRVLDQMSGRLAQATAKRAGIDAPPRERIGVSIVGRRARRDAVLALEAGSISLGDGRELSHPDLYVRPTDRIGFIGPNGSGKSTLLRRLLTAPVAAAADSGAILSIAQELSADEAAALVDEVRSLGGDERGRVLSTVSRLGSEPTRILSTVLPSPGEARKLALAVGLERSPEVIVMDEPTNHLDLVSIRCLEEALAEFVGALILVSHDRRFLERLIESRWRIIVRADRPNRLQIEG